MSPKCGRLESLSMRMRIEHGFDDDLDDPHNDCVVTIIYLDDLEVI